MSIYTPVNIESWSYLHINLVKHTTLEYILKKVAKSHKCIVYHQWNLSKTIKYSLNTSQCIMFVNISFSHNLFILNDIKYVLKLTSIYIYIYKHTQLD